MANPFDQFDEAVPAAKGNPFDQFDGPAAKTEPAKKEPGFADTVKDVATQYLRIPSALVGNRSASLPMAKGVVSGVADLGNTLINAITPAIAKLFPEVGKANDERNAALKSFNDENKRDPLFEASRLYGNVGATYPVGGLIGQGVKAALPASKVAQVLGDAIASGGFKVGEAGNFAGRTAARVTGGVINGAASTALVHPEDAKAGALFGAALPVGVAGVGKLTGTVGKIYNRVTSPQEAAVADKLADYLGIPKTELQAALSQQGPQMIPGYRPTVPQIVQTPEASQLQRTLKTAGQNHLGDAEQMQQAQFREALGRIAEPAPTVTDAAIRAGDAIQRFAVPERSRQTEAISKAFDGVDPLDESALFLPIDEMKKARDRFLGPGTFGTGSKANEAIRTAENLGRETTEAIKPMSAKQAQDLVLAVRAEGGINVTSKSGRELAGEIRNLRESGLNNLVKPNTGLSVERMAERMHEAGYLPDNDPVTLLNLLHESATGNKVYASNSDDAYRAMMEQSMGPPPVAETLDKTAPFQTIQNLRSSMGEAAQQAEAHGANKEAAALKQMVAEIDSRINRAAGESVGEGEFFPKDMADRYRQALKLHADKMRQFETGPQVGMFRKGQDGQPAVQGAEIPGKFYSGRRSQVEDVDSFKRLIGDDRADLMDEMKRYAITEGLDKKSSMGNLGQSFLDWMASRSGGNRAMFNEQELATLNEVGKAVERQIVAENLGRVSGPDTAQKLQSLQSLGMLDKKGLDIAARKVPFGSAVLSGVRDFAQKGQNKAWSGLMANPEQFAKALSAAEKQKLAQEALRQFLDGLAPAQVGRAAPLLLSDQ